MTATDEQLMARYRGGDAAAFDALYRRYRGPVFRYVQRLAGRGADVEGLYQDAWLRVIAAREQWCEDQAFRPWLSGSALLNHATPSPLPRSTSMTASPLASVYRPTVLPPNSIIRPPKPWTAIS